MAPPRRAGRAMGHGEPSADEATQSDDGSIQSMTNQLLNLERNRGGNPPVGAAVPQDSPGNDSTGRFKADSSFDDDLEANSPGPGPGLSPSPGGASTRARRRHGGSEKIADEFSRTHLMVKGCVCWALLLFVWKGAVQMFRNDQLTDSCASAEDAALCGYMVFGFLLSCVLLVPNLLEMGHLFFLLLGNDLKPNWDSIYNLSHVSPIYYAMTGFFAALASVVSVLLFAVLLLVIIPLHLLSDDSSLQSKSRKVLSHLFALAPDTVLTWSLFALSYVVIFSSEKASDVITNLVAVQVFASLDDFMVQMLLSPSNNLQSTFELYLRRPQPVAATKGAQ